MPDIDPNRIDALPTKSLFTFILTRDIELGPAIVDLVDNCVDGAKKLRGNTPFKGLWVEIILSATSFEISDNCGGIEVETARHYAFRFGRADGAPIIRHSVGQFGIGMKRALFKMGNHFDVDSATEHSAFSVNVSVPAWLASPEWTFTFAKLRENIDVPKPQQGTKIVVSELHEEVRDSFRSERFRAELHEALRTKLSDPLRRGLSISLNGLQVTSEPLLLLSAAELLPAFKAVNYEKQPVVHVKTYCGLGPSEETSDAGWHVFCNGRLVLLGDKTERTGWGYAQSGLRIPSFHGQYNRLRGIVYFDCDDAGKLPWSTTKTDVIESPVYRTARVEMVNLMRPVVDFLNAVKKERDDLPAGHGSGPLERLMEHSPKADISKIHTRAAFIMPNIRRKAVKLGPPKQRITYERPVNQVEAAMRTLRVRTYKDVGEKTFDYFYNAEVEE